MQFAGMNGAECLQYGGAKCITYSCVCPKRPFEFPTRGDGLRHDSNPTKLGLMDCAGLADAYLIGMSEGGMSEGPNFDAAMERRFQEYVEDLGAVVGNDARRRGLSDYMTGLLLPGERKSMEPIAERLESGNVSRRHQSIPAQATFRQRSQLEGRPRARAGARSGCTGDAEARHHQALDRR